MKGIKQERSLRKLLRKREKMDKIIVAFTCFNRKDKTLNCIHTIKNGNPHLDFLFVVCDDASKDGTYEALLEIDNVKVIRGNGGLYYTGGMRKAIGYIINERLMSDYVLLINDDVSFFNQAIERMVIQQKRIKADVIVGCTCDNEGRLTYGGITYPKNGSLKYTKHGPGMSDACDTFHANCVLMTYETFIEAGNMDECYHYSLGDFDYGLKIKKNGKTIKISDNYVGTCIIDKKEGTYRDQSLSRIQRIIKKESAKGVPTKEWFHFVHKNFGLVPAIIHSIGPYIKIILGK